MAQFYKILKADPLGTPWTPNQPGAKPIQTYWCQVEGLDKDVSIGKQVGNTIVPGEYVYGDLVYAKSQRGTEYWKLKSAMVPEGVQRPADSPAQAAAQEAVGQPAQGIVGEGIPGWAIPLYNMVEYIYKEMKKMDADAKPEEPASIERDTVEPLDPATQARIEEMFTPDEIAAEELGADKYEP